MIYELTEGERAVMRKLVEGGHVVTIGKHARVKEAAEDALQYIEGTALSLRNHGFEGSAMASEAVVKMLRGKLGEQGEES